MSCEKSWRADWLSAPPLVSMCFIDMAAHQILYAGFQVSMCKGELERRHSS